jgi:hypothetical protein
MFRRAFSTTARFLKRANEEAISPTPPAPKRLPHARNSRDSVYRPWVPRPPKSAHSGRDQTDADIDAAKDVDLIITGTSIVIYWIFEPWLAPWGCGKLLREPGEAMFHSVREFGRPLFRRARLTVRYRLSTSTIRCTRIENEPEQRSETVEDYGFQTHNVVYYGGWRSMAAPSRRFTIGTGTRADIRTLAYR